MVEADGVVPGTLARGVGWKREVGIAAAGRELELAGASPAETVPLGVVAAVRSRPAGRLAWVSEGLPADVPAAEVTRRVATAPFALRISGRYTLKVPSLDSISRRLTPAGILPPLSDASRMVALGTGPAICSVPTPLLMTVRLFAE